MQPKITSKGKKTQGTRAAKQKREITFPLEKENFMFIGLGILVVIIGYFLMAGNSVDGFLPTVLSPIFLVLGYCVIIPFGILKKTKSDNKAAITETSAQATVSTVSSNVSSNIKTS
jgi:membrane protein CcdC involved in cytochrome C biogenesis